MASTTREPIGSGQDVADLAGLAARPREAAGCGRLAVGLTFLVVLAVLTVVGYKVLAGAGWPQSETATGAAEPGVFTSGQSGETRLRQAPDFTLQLFSGETLRLADLRGKPVLINYWAAWCPPCRDEAPVLERVWQEYRAKDVVFVGVDIWDSEDEARKFLDRYGISYPNGQDPRGTTAIDYAVRGIPETFFVDRQGQITRKWNGPLSESRLRTFLDEIVGPGSGS